MRPYERFQSMIEYYCQLYSVPPDLVKRQVMAESSGNPRAVSRAGAKGLMQLMPGTAWELGVKDPFNPDDNLRGGVEYLARMKTAVAQLVGPDVSMTRDDLWRCALASYNGGYGYVRRAIRSAMEAGQPLTWPSVLHELHGVRIGRKRPMVSEIQKYVERVLPVHTDPPVVASGPSVLPGIPGTPSP